MGIADVFSRRSDGSSEAATPVPPPVRPSVAEQVATLSRLGLEPVGVTVADLTDDREATLLIKKHPYVATMHGMARDQEGNLTHHPKVTTVDLEHVIGPDSYPDLVRKLAGAAGTLGMLSDVTGSVDRARGRWTLRFTFGGLTREIHPLLDHDRADADVLPEIYQAVAGPDQRPAKVRHGQTVTVAYVPSQHRAELQRILDRWAMQA